MERFPLSSQRYIEAITIETERLADAASHDLRSAVPSCPGWDVFHAVVHVGIRHRWATAMVTDSATERLDHNVIERPSPESDPLSWLRDGAEKLAAALGAAGPCRRVWTLVSEQGSTAFWFRRMAQETLVHRIDIEHAIGRRSDVDPLLAADGIDEYWSVFLSRRQRAVGPDDAVNTRLDVETTDVSARWLIELAPGKIAISTDSGTSCASTLVRGPAASLLCLMWNRPPSEPYTIMGDRSVLDRWTEFVRF